MTILETQRLILRPWKDSDKAPFAVMNADPKVMQHFPGLMTPENSDAMVARIQAHFEQHAYGFYALERKDTGDFIGFTGIQNISFEAHFTPAVEIGWRLSAPHWNKGYATEAAQRVLDHAFNEVGLNEIVSFTALANHPSRRVMEKLGMTTDPTQNFAHPRLPADHPLSEHILYRISKPL